MGQHTPIQLDGPWQQEPDELLWIDAATGMECAIYRVSHSGHLCGYVRIPEGHPLHGVSYNSPVPQSLADHIERVKSGPVGKRSALDIFCFALGDGESMAAGMLFNVHGGITYSEKWIEGGYWYGFDCAHAGDLCPASRYSSFTDGEYRDMEYVKEECASLAAQLHRLAATGAGNPT